ncbi:MAG: hypothetical protein AB8H86_22995 [Polyangiales bacterium]
MTRTASPLALTLLVACGATTVPAPAGDSWNPMPDYAPLAAGDVACASDDECGGEERCLPPESLCSEDAPGSTPLCPIGSTANQCAYCLLECGEAAAPCEPGYQCHGGFCVSPLRCALPTPVP